MWEAQASPLGSCPPPTLLKVHLYCLACTQVKKVVLFLASGPGSPIFGLDVSCCVCSGRQVLQDTSHPSP